MKIRCTLQLMLLTTLLSPYTTVGQGCHSTVTGTLKIEHLHSSTFGDEQTLRIWLPEGYTAARGTSRTYPVLFMLDGQNLFDVCTAGGDPPAEWHIDETLTALIAAGKIEPLMVVGIDTPGKRREDEYLPYPDPLFANRAAPHGSKLPAFLADEVLPYVSEHYRVRSGPTSTAIGGSSYGAVAALYALLQRPDLFGLGLLESASLQVGNGQILRDISPLAIAPTRVYVGVGTNEISGHEKEMKKRGLDPNKMNIAFVNMSKTLVENLRRAQLNTPECLFLRDVGAEHHENFWARRFPRAIQFLFPSAIVK